jgi:hypothetical protein
VGLIGADHGLGQDVGVQRLMSQGQVRGQRFDLIPQRLRIDDQALPLHDARLPLEREMVEILRHRDLDRELHRILAALGQLRRPGRGLDAALASAAVLLPLVLATNEPPLEDIRLEGFLELPGPFLKLPAALGAGLVGNVELVDLLHDRQLGLLAGAMAALGLSLFVSFCRSPSLLARISEELLIAPRELLLQLFELHCQVQLRLALEGQILTGQRQILLDELVILLVEKHRCLPENVDIVLSGEVQHAAQSTACL